MTEDEQAPRKKSNVLKWVLIGCGSITLVGMIGIGLIVYFVSQAVTLDPVKVEEMARKIFPMETPAGMKGIAGWSVWGVEGAILGSDQSAAGGKGLFIMSFPPEMSKDEMQRQMDEKISDQEQEQGAQVEQKKETFTIRGQEIEGQVTVFQEGEGEDAPRNVQVLILTKEGDRTVMIVFVGSEAEVTKEYVQANLDTVK